MREFVSFIDLCVAINKAVDNKESVYCYFPVTENAALEFENNKIELDYFKTGARLGNEKCDFNLEENDISNITIEYDEYDNNTYYCFAYNGSEGGISISHHQNDNLKCA